MATAFGASAQQPNVEIWNPIPQLIPEDYYSCRNGNPYLSTSPTGYNGGYTSTYTIVMFRVVQFEPAQSQNVAKKMCSADVKLVDYSGANTALTNVPMFPTGDGANMGFFYVNPGNLEEDDILKIRIRNIRLKNGANPCSVSSLTAPNQTFTFMISDPLSGSYCDYVEYDKTTSRNATMANEEKENIAISMFPITGIDTRKMLEAQVIPQGNSAQLVVFSKTSGDAAVMVADLSGRVLRQQNMSLQEGINHLDLNLDAPSGIYIVNINNGKEIKTVKFVKTN
jgi:hypothetical protein